MNEPGVGPLLDQSTLAARVEGGRAPDWLVVHFETFRAALTGDHDGEPFPCCFGVESVRRGDPLLVGLSSPTDPDSLLRFRDALLEYLKASPDHGEPSSLVAFVRPADEEAERDYHERLWHLLQFLHVHDPEPWPDDIPTDPDHQRWEFCFGGEPIFPTCRAPFDDKRRSRYCPVGLKITSQPRTPRCRRPDSDSLPSPPEQTDDPRPEPPGDPAAETVSRPPAEHVPRGRPADVRRSRSPSETHIAR